MLSTKFSRKGPPEGQNFTIRAENFLPVGNGFLNLAARGTKRHGGRDGHDAKSAPQAPT